MYLSNASLSELQREAEYTNNELALRILNLVEEDYEKRLEESQANERDVNDEIREYAVDSLNDLGNFIACLIVDIREGKGGKMASHKAATSFQQCAEDNIDADSYEVLSPMINKIVKACH